MRSSNLNFVSLGEGHGFRGAAATKMALNGAYYFFCKVLRINPSVTAKVFIKFTCWLHFL